MPTLAANPAPSSTRLRDDAVDLARVLSLLERLAAVLATAPADRTSRTAAELEEVACRLITALRARGLSDPDVVARMTRFVEFASPPGTSPGDVAATTTAVCDWCARADAAWSRRRTPVTLRRRMA